MKNILICTNSFKGALSPKSAGECIKEVLGTYPELDTRLMPLADGGDGTLEVLAPQLGVDMFDIETIDPLGRKIVAKYGWREDSKIGLVELAEASGIRHLNDEELDPWRATTHGTGLIINHLVEIGSKEIYLALGGSASVDGGAGLLQAMGMKFLDEEGREIHDISPSKLRQLVKLDREIIIGKTKGTRINVLCDVENPLLGQSGSAQVFAPQKGASELDVLRLEIALVHFAEKVREQYNLDVSRIKHGGAAGGASAFLYGILNAGLINGVSMVMEIGGFKDKLDWADMIVTGEGRLDIQSLSGKALGKIAALANAKNKPVVVFCGENKLPEEYGDLFDMVCVINKSRWTMELNIEQCQQNLAFAVQEWTSQLEVH